MAPRLTTEEKIQRLVAKCRDRVEAAQPPPQSLSHTSDSRLGSLAREAGYERLSSQFCEKLGDLLRDAGVGTHPDLTDPMNTRDTRIHFYDLEHPLPGHPADSSAFSDRVRTLRFLGTELRRPVVRAQEWVEVAGP